VHAKLAQIGPDDCAVSTITRYELMLGVAHCKDPKREQKKVETFLHMVHLFVFDDLAADMAAIVRANLEKKGRMIGPYDVLLAAQALTQSLVLVTNNRREFVRVENLHIEDWSQQ